MRHPSIAIGIGLLVALSSTAQAVLITSGTGKVLLDDNFELPLPGSSPNNGIFPGTWIPSGGVAVTNAANPGPVYGRQYAHLVRAGGAHTDLGGQFAQTVSSGTIHAEFMANINTTSAAAFGITQTDTGFHSAQVWLMTFDDQTIRYYGDGAYRNTGLSYSPGNWQLWQIDADMDAKRYTLTVD